MMAVAQARVVISALQQRADGVAVLPLLGRGTAVVGGFVRDALLGREPREIDLLVEGDAIAVARELAARVDGRVASHRRFGTHTVSVGEADRHATHLSGRSAGQAGEEDRWVVDIAAARSESYARPGALPDVAPASMEQDLGRRDFTVNAIALRGDELLAVPDALEDLSAQRLRVLHERSFEDDPTRLVRLVRYSERLGFDVAPRTAELAAAGTLDGLSPARLGSELRLALREPNPLAVLARLPVGFDRALAERALALAPQDVDRDVLLLGACQPSPEIEASSAERAVLKRNHAALARQMSACARASELWLMLHGVAPESVVLAGASGAPDAARRWLSELRGVRLELDGTHLLAAGIPAGPRIGALLQATMCARLDGELGQGHDEQLRFALAADTR